MKEHIYNKLVRDNVPDIIREQGGTPVIRTLGDEEYVQCLENKLREEVGEFLEERTLDELGDIIEVLEELAHLQGWTDWEIRHARSEKAQRNGIFRERASSWRRCWRTDTRRKRIWRTFSTRPCPLWLVATGKRRWAFWPCGRPRPRPGRWT